MTSNIEIIIKLDGRDCFRYNHGGSWHPIRLRVEPESKILYLSAYGRVHHYPLAPIPDDIVKIPMVPRIP